jgi:protein phosphatase
VSDETDDVRRRDVFTSSSKTVDFKPSSATVRADFAARTHRGRMMQENEDHHLVIRLGRHQETIFTSLSMRDVVRRFDEYSYFAVVADGIGGGGTGAAAARIAVSTLADLGRRFGKWNMRIDAQTAADIMEQSEWFYRLTHEAVLTRRRAQIELARMATTLTGIYSAGTDMFVAHVGHSRCYLYRGGLLTQLTSDHTLQQHFLTSRHPASVGEANEDQRHVLTDVLGGRPDPGVLVERFQLMNDDWILLCTNGLTDMVEDDVIAEVLASPRSPLDQCDLLIDLALASGGEDNVTAVLAHYTVPAPDRDNR